MLYFAIKVQKFSANICHVQWLENWHIVSPNYIFSSKKTREWKFVTRLTRI